MTVNPPRTRVPTGARRAKAGPIHVAGCAKAEHERTGVQVDIINWQVTEPHGTDTKLVSFFYANDLGFVRWAIYKDGEFVDGGQV
jgi:hypothetical protein